MPADPIEFRIVQHLQTALLAISMAGGYHHDVTALAVKLDPDQNVEALIAPDGPRPFLVLDPQPETWDYAEMPNMVHLVFPVTVHWIGAAVPDDDDSRLQSFFRGCADIEQAITQDGERGGLAVGTRIVKRTLDLAVGGTQVWALVDLEIHVRRTFGQPNG